VHKNTSLTHDQQYTQMTLWSIARSPLFFGGVATLLDKFTTDLLTNVEVLKLNSASSKTRQVQGSADSSSYVWVSGSDAGGGAARYAALFNTGNLTATVSVSLKTLGIKAQDCKVVRNVWSGEKMPGAVVGGVVSASVNSDGAVLLALENCK
jgi:hypothetical protein